MAKAEEFDAVVLSLSIRFLDLGLFFKVVWEKKKEF